MYQMWAVYMYTPCCILIILGPTQRTSHAHALREFTSSFAGFATMLHVTCRLWGSKPIALQIRRTHPACASFGQVRPLRLPHFFCIPARRTSLGLPILRALHARRSEHVSSVGYPPLLSCKRGHPHLRCDLPQSLGHSLLGGFFGGKGEHQATSPSARHLGTDCASRPGSQDEVVELLAADC